MEARSLPIIPDSEEILVPLDPSVLGPACLTLKMPGLQPILSQLRGFFECDK